MITLWNKIKFSLVKKLGGYCFLDLRQPVGSPYEFQYGYRDSCERLLYACFNTLVEYVEGYYESIEKYRKFIEEDLKNDPMCPHQYQCEKKALELYLWWKNELPKLNKKLHSDISDEEYCVLDSKIEETITKKLKELMEIRGVLWR